jgi:predicted nucleotide-binding protein
MRDLLTYVPSPAVRDNAEKALSHQPPSGLTYGSDKFHYVLGRWNQLKPAAQRVLEAVEETSPRPADQPPRNPHKVFVVHGRNTNAKDGIFSFLESLNLMPLKWPDLFSKTKGGSPYILEIVTTGVSAAQAIIVLLTPDELVQLRRRYREPNNPEDERLSCQSRPNVFLEAGMALVTHPSKTIFLQIGDLRLPSDIDGKYVMRWDNSADARKLLADKLQEIGCATNTEGSRWLSTGQIDIDSLSLSNHERKAFFHAELDLTEPEKVLLQLAIERGHIMVDAGLDRKRVDFMNAESNAKYNDSPRGKVIYLEALERLCEKGLARNEGGCVYNLTTDGWKAADTLKA